MPTRQSRSVCLSANAAVAAILRRKGKLLLRRQRGEVKPRLAAETKNISIS
jgi:hypothetical protein